MATNHRPQRVLNSLLIVVFLTSFVLTAPVQASVPTRPQLQTGGEGPRLGYDAETGRLNFVGGSQEAPLGKSRVGASAGEARASAEGVLAQYAGGFGLTDPARELTLDRVDKDEQGSTLRYQQAYQGIPVIGGEMLVNSGPDGSILSLSGEVSPHLVLKTTQAAVSAEAALAAAQAGMKEWYGLEADQLQPAEPALWVYDPRLLGPGEGLPQLVWRVELRPAELEPVNELVLVDAASGRVVLHFNQIDSARPDGRAQPKPAQQSALTWYVSTRGSDQNQCLSPEHPCATIKHAISLAANNDTIKVASGTYRGTVEGTLLVGDRDLLGGWNEDFSAQTGYSIYDGEGQPVYVRIMDYCSQCGNLYQVLSRFIVTRTNNTDLSSAVVSGGGNLEVRDCAIVNNTGGGLLVQNLNTLTITNTTLAENTGMYGGRGLDINGYTTAALNNVTIVNNHSTSQDMDGAGGGLELGSAKVTISNSIIADNTAYKYPDISAGKFSFSATVVSGGHNLFGDITGSGMTPADTDLVGVGAHTGPIGPQGHYSLLPGSPAIDGGSPLPPGSEPSACPVVDAVGTPRPIDGDQAPPAVCDMGALEVQPVSTIEGISLWAGGNQTAQINRAFDENLVVRVLDSQGNPWQGAEVTFRLPVSGPGGSFGGEAQVAVVTGEDGLAEAPILSANGEAGLFVVEASVSGTTASVLIEMENYLPQVTVLETEAGNQQVAGPDGIFAQNFQVKVLDQHRRGMEGIAVNFTAPSSGASGTFADSGSSFTTVTSAADGIATAPVFTSNRLPGTYRITASTAGTVSTASLQLSNTDDLYVSPSGLNGAHPFVNDCRSPDSPCQTINYAIGLANHGAVLFLSEGVYTEETISVKSKKLVISGGWTAGFTRQLGYSILKSIFLEIKVDSQADVSHVVMNGRGIVNSGILTFTDGAAINGAIGINNSGIATLTNVTLSNNNTGFYSSGNAVLRNITIANNKTRGLYVGKYYSGTAEVSLQNSIISGNPSNCEIATGTRETGVITSLGYNLFASSPACTGNVLTLHSSDLVGVNAGITPLINNLYHGLVADSPAIDRVEPQGQDTYCPSTDQRGIPRPAANGCDSGAYEYIPPTPPAAILPFSGAGQTVGFGVRYLQPVKAQVIDANGSPVPGVSVTFTSPETGPSAVFTDTRTSTTISVTDATGTATSSLFVSRNTPGSYMISAAVSGLDLPAEFSLATSSPRYVDALNGVDPAKGSMTCDTINKPCKTIQFALDHANAGDLVLVTAAEQQVTAKEVSITKQIRLVGGWSSDFTQQIGQTNLSAKTYGFGIGNVFARIENFDIINAANIGIYTYNSDVELSQVSISNVHLAIQNNGRFSMTRGSIHDTVHAVYNTYSSSLTLENVTISRNNCYGNDCETEYPLLSNSSTGQITLKNVTITDNFSFSTDRNQKYRAILHNGYGKVYVHNTLIARNRANNAYNCSGEVISLGYNLLGVLRGCTFKEAQGDLIGIERDPVVPGLADLADNGGGSLTNALLTGSPALNAGDPADCPATDQRGVPRSDGACDIGAYEGSVEGGLRHDLFTFTAKNDDKLPGTFLCQGPSASCTNGSDLDADLAHHYADAVYEFYLSRFDRDSLDGTGMPIISTVHYKGGYENAFWDGEQVTYGDGFSRADDVVAHELTHGVTEHTAKLFNFYQSGAINESISDMWGEYFDQTNGEGSDGPENAWLIGEDLPIGAIRSMSNPPQFGHPDKVSSRSFLISFKDNGGVHINSGVNNKAVYLLVDGGTFNRKTIKPLGWDKTAAIYYYTVNHLLTSGANYADLYQAVNQACSVLIDGTAGITADDCQQVRNATDAVEMNRKTQVEADYCPAGYSKTPTDLFFDDFENGAAQWAYGAIEGNPHWSVAPGTALLDYAASGEYALFGNDYDETLGPGSQISDSYAALSQQVAIAPGVRTFLFFRHSFGFEFGIYAGNSYYFDGGFLEYSVNNGETWKDANALLSGGQGYRGRIYGAGYYGHNPNNGRSGFVGDSRGYVSSRYELTRMAGKNVLVRWRSSTDYTGYRLGWVVDDVAIYTCIRNPKTPALSQPAKESLSPTYTPTLTWLPAEFAARYELQVATTPDFLDLLISRGDLTGTQYTFIENLPSNTRFYWRVRAFSSIDVASAWSQVRTFRTRLVAPQPGLPASHGAVDSLRPTFRWSEAPAAASYRLVVSTRADLASPKLSVNVTGARYTPAVDLPAGKLLYWRVMANGANPSVWSSVFDLTTPLPPSIPKAASPGLNALVPAAAVELKWTVSKTVSGAPALAAYHLEVDDSADFSSPLLTRDDLTANTLNLPAVLPSGSKVYWRVRAVNEQGQYSSWSSSYFRTFIQPPDLIAPPEGTSVADTTPTFDWSDSTGATSYSVLITPGTSMSSPLVSTSVTISTYTPVKPLPAGKVLYWRVRANGPNGLSAWSGPWQFQVQ